MADQRIAIDRERCAGHGRCYTVAPEIFEPDDEGFAVVTRTPGGERLENALAAAVRNCPERAVVVD
ncbi:ferredoxin [Amycolatopsis methanolica]|uniref:3Fe-4S ferredoxin n=1 Tax=Amycolatopsis methanolica 239 TaxID=1068978 RepID=A0A076MQX9_AMYME|nr:ferredoxin [Amycolatopsis methanolica]AIJ23293.1 3Fe-4S ferredoxin [Amycolatopsis methanolica 239]